MIHENSRLQHPLQFDQLAIVFQINRVTTTGNLVEPKDLAKLISEVGSYALTGRDTEKVE